MRVQVAIVGSGPAGLLLGQLLHLAGIETIILEQRSREYVMARIRAGVLEQGTVDLLERAGAGARLRSEGLVHTGLDISHGAARHRIDLNGLTGGRNVTVYGQTEITRDLIAARDAGGAKSVYEVDDVSIADFDQKHPRVRYRKDGVSHEIECEFIAGCDGYHGVCRPSVASSALVCHERVMPTGWLGLLADVPPVSPELIYINHERGFALCSVRSRTRSRYYLQCAPDDSVAHWPQERFWDELRLRLDPETARNLVTGPALEMSVTPLRSMVVEPMRFGRLFLAGDAAHVMPPTGAKGLNLAASDVFYLSTALLDYYRNGSESGLDSYSANCLRRVWGAARFSWWMSNLLHRFPDSGSFGRKLQAAELDYLFSSKAAATSFAENYVGLPY